MARKDSDVKHKKHRSTTGQVQQMDPPSKESSDANVRKFGDTMPSNAADSDPDTSETDTEMSEDDDTPVFKGLSEETKEMMKLADDVQHCILDIDSAEVAAAFVSANDEPPITLSSLAELEMPRIINNPKLRQDVNFDRELHFRPNLEGPRGEKKMKQTEMFWKALIGELSMYARVQQELAAGTSSQNGEYWCKILATSEKRLPSIFIAIQEILFTLVPQRDQQIIDQRLDSDLLMQEIKNGVCDLVGLAEWMAKMLKCHCAPMRDAMVDEMSNTIVQGATEGRSDTLVLGIRQLLTILEAMKLDVANHQIRHLRPALVSDTVTFSRRYNAHRLAYGKVNVRAAHNFVETEMQTMIANGQSPTYLEALTAALLRSLVLSNDYGLMFPDIFMFDAERLKQISHMLHMGVYQHVCRDILRDVTVGLDISALVFDQAAATLKEKVTSITGITYKFFERIEHIAAEIMRIVLEMEGKSGTTDVKLLGEIEKRLQADLCTRETAIYEHLGTSAINRILPKLHESVANHIRKSALELMDTFVPITPSFSSGPFTGHGARLVPVAPRVSLDEDEDVIRRLTHILVLHWQVWAELAYLAPSGDDDDDVASSAGEPSPPSSRSVSPSQSVYDPGHEFLSTGSNVIDVSSRRSSPASSLITNGASEHSGSTAGQEQGEAQSKRPTIDPEQ